MFKRILIVVDPRAVSRAAVGVGAALAHTHGAEVVLFYVLPRFSVPVADMNTIELMIDKALTQQPAAA